MEETRSYFKKGYVQLLLTLILIGVVVALAAYAQLTFKEARGAYEGHPVINVAGEGEVLAKPDIGQFNFSVIAEGEDATSAQNQSAEASNEILAYLEEQGVAENDIKTSYYNLTPKYRYEERICPAGSFCPPGERVMDGFEVNQTIEVKVRDLENAGNLISGVGERGATNISNLNFTIDDTDALKAQARAEAIEKAQAKAEELADELGVRIVRMTGFYEDEGRYPVMYDGYGGDTAVAESRAIAPSIPTGENTITSRVNISYEVR